jgi:hypothetical protein
MTNEIATQSLRGNDNIVGFMQLCKGLFTYAIPKKRTCHIFAKGYQEGFYDPRK